MASDDLFAPPSEDELHQFGLSSGQRTQPQVQAASSPAGVDLSPPTKSELHQFGLDDTFAEKTLGVAGKVAKVVGPLMERLDSVTFAPIRAGIRKAQDVDPYDIIHGENQGFLSPLDRFMTEYLDKPARAAYDQFGELGGPTEKDIMVKARVPTEEKPFSKYAPFLYSDDPNQFQLHEGGKYDPMTSKADIAGIAAGVAVPAEASALGLLGRGVKGASKVIGKIPLGVAKDIEYVGEQGSKIGDKARAFVADVPEINARVFKERYPEVVEIYRKHKGNPLAASDEFRTQVLNDVQKTKDFANAKIDNFIKKYGKQGGIDYEDVISAGSEMRHELSKTLRGPERDAIKKALRDIENLDSDGDGTITVKNAFDLYNKHREIARGSYKKGGEIYTPSPAEAQVSRMISYRMGKKLKDLSQKTDNGDFALGLKMHAGIHDVDDALRPSVLAPGESPAAIYRAGTYADEPTRQALEKLGELTDKGDAYVKNAENISAMRAFYDPRSPGHNFWRKMSRTPVKIANKMTQPGLLGSPGYGDTTTGLLRGARMKSQDDSRKEKERRKREEEQNQ